MNQLAIQRVARSLVVLVVVAAGSSAFPAVPAPGTPCSGNTTGDTIDCDGTCSANMYIGVSMTLNDHDDESGTAVGDCSAAHATCSVNDLDWDCQAISALRSTSSSSWSCHFEAHDVWWKPDSGFSYNCYQSSTQGLFLGGVPDVEVVAPTCDAIAPARILGDALLGELCASLAAGDGAATVVPHADAQMILLARGGVAAGVGCDATGECWVIQPVCRPTADGFACDATPLRAS